MSVIFQYQCSHHGEFLCGQAITLCPFCFYVMVGRVRQSAQASGCLSIIQPLPGFLLNLNGTWVVMLGIAMRNTSGTVLSKTGIEQRVPPLVLDYAKMHQQELDAVMSHAQRIIRGQCQFNIMVATLARATPATTALITPEICSTASVLASMATSVVQK